jgi:hypothetical protein
MAKLLLALFVAVIGLAAYYWVVAPIFSTLFNGLKF